jgi:hypothetical protein
MSTVPKPARSRKSVRHTRAIQRARQQHPIAAPPAAEVQARLLEIVHPATLAQVAYFHQLGLRERTLGLVVMMALVLEMIWRHLGGVCELVRLIQTEAVLWAGPQQVSQQAFSQRLTTLPAELFLRVFQALVPAFQQRWAARLRPLPPEIAWAQVHYTAVQAVDASTLDALIRKLGLLQDLPHPPLAGKMTALLDLGSRLPRQVWYTPDPQAHDQRFWPQIQAVLRAGSLLVFDLGYLDFAVFAALTAAQVTFITRAKKNLAYTLAQVRVRTAAVHDYCVWVGPKNQPQLLRLVEVLHHGRWYRYLSNDLDTTRLPTAYLVALYWQRWRVEDAFASVKRLLGLAYFWAGAQNAVELQLWATWILYAVLVDLTDAVAAALHQPFAAVSLEMVYRSLYFYVQAHHRGDARDLVSYLAAHAKLFGLLKRPPKTKPPGPLEFIPPLLTDPTGP